MRSDATIISILRRRNLRRDVAPEFIIIDGGRVHTTPEATTSDRVPHSRAPERNKAPSARSGERKTIATAKEEISDGDIAIRARAV